VANIDYFHIYFLSTVIGQFSAVLGGKPLSSKEGHQKTVISSILQKEKIGGM
jgi:hypothetical protein